MKMPYRAFARRLLGSIALAAASFTAHAAASQYLLAIDGVLGESTLIGHENAIDVDSFRWGLTPHGGQPPSFDDFQWQQALDRSTPPLMQMLALGTPIAQAELSIVRASNPRQAYFTITFTDVLLSSLQISGGGGDVPKVDGAFSYGQVSMAYRRQKADGSLDAPITASFDLASNTGSLTQLLSVFALGTGGNAIDPAPVPLAPTAPLLLTALAALVTRTRRRPR